MYYNYHTHTMLCGHASGTMEEYVINAISWGIKTLGFSDHIPLKLKGGYQAPYRVPVEKVDFLKNEINRLKEKYLDKIDVKFGFETEYYEEIFDQMLADAISWGAEYLILGQHFTSVEYNEETKTYSRHTIKETSNIKDLENYFNSLIGAIKTKKFTCVAHPDIVNYVGDQNDFIYYARKFIKTAKNYNVPLEINFLGIRDKRNYPNPLFWKIVGEEGAPVTFGLDSHRAEDVIDNFSLKIANEMIQKYNLNYIGKPKLVSLK